MPANSTTSPNIRPMIGVSSCLMGQKVRYDGEHQFQPLVHQHFADAFDIVTFCPEMAIGLGVPRAKIQLVEREQQIVCLDQATESIDYTHQLAQCCQSEADWLSKICGYVFKTKSPSCGVSQVKTRRGQKLIADGQGIFASALISLFPDLPVIEDHQLINSPLSEQFKQSALAYHQKHHH